jgi:hypothetical protein
MWQVVANITLLMIAYGVTLSGIMLLDDITTFSSLQKKRNVDTLNDTCDEIRSKTRFAIKPASRAVLSILQRDHNLSPLIKMEYDGS